jgi:drug/metabolite transporter (DMT)-like permease
VNQHSPTSFLNPKILIPFATITLIWGSTWFVIRGQIAEVPASWGVTYRFLVAGIAMLLLAAFNRQRISFTAREFGFAALVGAMQFTSNFNLVYQAEHHITSGLVAVVFALLVVPNAILGRIFLGDRVAGRFIFGAAFAMIGVALLFVHEVRADPGGADETLLGVGLTILAVLTASVANVMQASPPARQLPMMSLIGWSMLFGTALNALWSLVTVGPPVVPTTPGFYLGLAYLSLAASALTFTFYFGLIRVIGPGKAGFSNVLIPVVAMGISTLFEGYQWSLMAAAGGIIVLIGMVIALSSPKRAADS